MGQRGLYHKYRVERVDGKPIGRVFVLEYEKDPIARAALEIYAIRSYFHGNRKLAYDLIRALEETHDNSGSVPTRFDDR